MTITLAAKKAVVEEVTAVASKAIAAVVADYRGLTVNQMTQLRSEARKSNVYLKVVRNTLTRRAFENTPFSCLSENYHRHEARAATLIQIYMALLIFLEHRLIQKRLQSQPF